ncbi:MEKHLA domain-containing protein [Hyphomicrobium sp. CS1GBMeth3]|uniref:MEKHLA domain-containing protein n=1 Tax=Hyphomicrobium sp. CS1GBMeth3 TaxID=1892845 RepID=UPI000930F585|nr:MEKHLA domain-containing protein [Hyphomicrobium sp. CS1GBMeth3]
MDLPHFTDEQRCSIEFIGDSYQRLTGHPLVSGEGDLIERLWSAPLAIVAHGTQSDPIFFFGNRTALTLFEMDFAAFTRLPSRFSAEPPLREERTRLLERVTRDGVINDYAGVRISATGKRFRISNASVWSLTDATGQPIGQAAAFTDWVYVAQSG